MTAIPPFMSATPGPAEHACRLEPAQRLERMIGAEHRVHVAGEQQLHRRVGPDRQMQVAAMRRLRCARPSASIASTGAGSTSAISPGSAAKASASSAGDRRQPGEVARSAVDRRPGLDLAQHRRRRARARRTRCSMLMSAPPWRRGPSAACGHATQPTSPANAVAAIARYMSRLNGTISSGSRCGSTHFQCAEFGMLGGDVDVARRRRGSAPGTSPGTWPLHLPFHNLPRRSRRAGRSATAADASAICSTRCGAIPVSSSSSRSAPPTAPRPCRARPAASATPRRVLSIRRPTHTCPCGLSSITPTPRRYFDRRSSCSSPFLPSPLPASRAARQGGACFALRRARGAD